MTASDQHGTGNTKQQLKRRAKNLLYTTLFAGAFLLGEYVSPIQTIQEEIRYHNISAENGFPQDFRELEKVVVINEKNRAEVYFGNVEDSTLHPVKEDYHTRRPIGKQIDSYITSKYQKLDSLVRTYTNDWFDNEKTGSEETRVDGDSTTTDTSKFKQAWDDIKEYVGGKLD
ncbi:MAG: hypothetical protein ACOCZV_01000 [Nanoarchaeota archaeon]